MLKRLNIFAGIRWRFIVTYILLIFIAMQVISAYFNQELESHYVNDFTTMLDQQAGLLVYNIQNDLEESDSSELEPYEGIHDLVDKMFASIPHVEVQIIDANGIIKSVSPDNQTVVGQRNNQAEVKRALSGTRDDNIRIHPHNGHRMKIIAVPIKLGGEVAGAIYIAASMEQIYSTIADINLILATGTVIALILTALVGILLAGTITRPIKEMTKQTTAMAEGDFTNQVKVYGKDEIGMLALGINDLSQRLSQALSANEEEKNKLASILFYMSDGVIATDRKGQVMLMNHKAELMLDQRETDVLGAKLSDVLNFPDEVEQEMLFKENGRFLMDVQQDGHPFTIQVNVTPLHSGDEVQGVIAVLQDVTQQEQLERERKEFVANVSHELRTPLTTIKSYMEALSEGAKDNPELMNKFLDVIANETERMIRLVRDLLHLSKMDTKRSHIQLQETDVNRLIRHVADRFAVPLLQRQLSLELDLEVDMPQLKLDSDQVIQVLDNIITNALKYSFANGKIHIRTQTMYEQILIEIQDEGIGIPKNELQHIFKRFYRVDKARSREMGGTGLGLSITREMVLAHHGHIEIESDIGEGTIVRIYFPTSLDERGKIV